MEKGGDPDAGSTGRAFATSLAQVDPQHVAPSWIARRSPLSVSAVDMVLPWRTRMKLPGTVPPKVQNV
jgi:hypothetical protein